MPTLNEAIDKLHYAKGVVRIPEEIVVAFPVRVSNATLDMTKTNRERSNDQVDCHRLCPDLGVAGAGFAACNPASAGPNGHPGARGLRRRHASHCEWRLH
jgi:hypothetical protein